MVPTDSRVAGQVEGESTHEAEGAGLAHEGHVDAARPGQSQTDGGDGHQTFSAQGNHGDGDGHRAYGEDADGGRDQQHPIRSRVEDLTQGRHLVQATSQLAIHPVGGAKGGEKDRSRKPIPMPGLYQQATQRQVRAPSEPW